MKSTEPAGPLFTDLYELTMAAGYFEHGLNHPATFSVFIRDPYRTRNYFVTAGLESVLNELENYRFTEEDIGYLRSRQLFKQPFFDFLRQMRFTGDVVAMPEGTLCFPDEPVMEITAPMIEAQLLETFVLNTVGLATMVASKAARCLHAANGRSLVDFSLRRTQGRDAGLQVARSTHIAGFASTSNVEAGKRLGLPISGTMAHSFVTAFSSEIEAFRAFAESFPDNAVFLIDTYDTLEGAKNAAVVAREMKARGLSPRGVRLDSGDMVILSREVRKILDAEGFSEMKIFASSGFDEFKIESVLSAGAAIDAFGVGTKMGVSADAPFLDIVYKLVKFHGRNVRKLSPGKTTLAGEKQVFRFAGETGTLDHHVIGAREEKFPKGAPLLQTVMAGGRRTAPSPELSAIRGRFEEEFSRLPERFKSLRSSEHFPVRISERLKAMQKD